MKLPRRGFLHLAASAAALPIVSRIASAQTYPSRPVRWIVGFAAGGTNDILARLMAQGLSDRPGQKANPGKINFASPGNGTAPHMAGELFKMMSGVNMVNVTYRGAWPAYIDLISGQVQIMFASMTGSDEQVRSGKLRVLAVTTATRSAELPDIPTVAEFVPGYEVSSWNGVGAPRNTPAEIVERLNQEINAGLADPKIKARYAELGATALAGSPADFGKHS